MRKKLCALALSVLMLLFAGCRSGENPLSSSMAISSPVNSGISAPAEAAAPEKAISAGQRSAAQQEEGKKMHITVGDYIFTVTLANNSSAQALCALLGDGPLTMEMSDYGGFEKVGSLGDSLPANDEYITAELGDITLYQGYRIAIYYAPNSWSLTRLGKIDDASLLKEALGDGGAAVTFSIPEQ